MNKQEMAGLISAKLGEILAATDFCLRTRDEGFVRTIPPGQPSILPHSQSVKICVIGG